MYVTSHHVYLCVSQATMFELLKEPFQFRANMESSDFQQAVAQLPHKRGALHHLEQVLDAFCIRTFAYESHQCHRCSAEEQFTDRFAKLVFVKWNRAAATVHYKINFGIKIEKVLLG